MRTPDDGGASYASWAYDGAEGDALAEREEPEAGGDQSAFAASCAASACCASWLRTSLRGGTTDFLFSFSCRTSQGGRISRTVLHSTPLAGAGGTETFAAGAAA